MRYLQRRGMRILATNFSCRQGEIDIIARDGETYVFVEVRSLGEGAVVEPRNTVTLAKRRRIIRAAHAYLRAKRLTDVAVRYDIVEVYLDARQRPARLEHYPDAFGAHGQI